MATIKSNYFDSNRHNRYLSNDFRSILLYIPKHFFAEKIIVTAEKQQGRDYGIKKALD